MSTDAQELSIDNQIDAIREFAEGRSLRLVRTYSDAGISGLALDNRPGLRRLLEDVASGEAPFGVVLIYDVSRWGRFQDTDEAAAYEFHCRSRGLEVVYVVEQFENIADPVNTLLKHMKRTMAAEYSRDLSRRITRAKLKTAGQGHWPCGRAPFGFERWAASPSGRMIKLEHGEMRHVLQWRTTLIPGPPPEVACVRRAFHLLVEHDLDMRELVERMTVEGFTTRRGRKWSSGSLRYVLTSRLYCGDLYFNRTNRVLKGDTKPVEPAKWVVVRDAFPAIVSRALVEKARARLNTKRRFWSDYTDEELLGGLRRLLAENGCVTHSMIKEDPRIPCVATYCKHFGSLGTAIGLAGDDPNRYALRQARMKASARLAAELSGQIRLHLREIGLEASAVTPSHFSIGDVTVAAIPALKRRPADAKRSPEWQFRVTKRWSDLIVAARIDEDLESVLDYRLLHRDKLNLKNVTLPPRKPRRPFGKPMWSVDEVAVGLAEAVRSLQ